MTQNTLASLKGGLIVSCQAYPGEALFGSDIMVRHALAAKDGGAIGIRANSPDDISAIKAKVGLPLIGLWKRSYPDSEVYITPTKEDVECVFHAGADIVAMDATMRMRPFGQQLEQIIAHVRVNLNCLLMADVSTLEEGLFAAKMGFDIISTTLSGYTPYSVQSEEPDFQLIRDLVENISIPVFAEGRIQTTDQAVRCFDCGAYALVIGGAITRPKMITERFVQQIQASQRVKL